MPRTFRIAASVVIVTANLIAATGCVNGPGEPQGGPPPQAFHDRPSLPSCGTVELGQGGSIPADAAACLANAGAAGAELAVRRPSIEGAPITEYYRALPGGGWEVYVDMTQDAWGGGWWLNACPDATGLDDLGECTSTQL